MPNHCTAVSLATILILHFEACVSTPPPQKATTAAGAAKSPAEQPGMPTPPGASQTGTTSHQARTSGAKLPQLQTNTPAAQELATFKRKVMTADYQADLEELGRLRDELSRWSNERELTYLARYWSGFASWRMAINGANHAMKVEVLTTNLKNAASEFYSSMRLKDDFTDAYAAATLVNSWLAVLEGSAAVPSGVRANGIDRERLSLSRTLLAKATALDAENPRVLWARGAFLLYAPESQGGSITGAIDIYRQMLKESERRGVDEGSPLPDWGKPEALMSLAYAHTRQKPPDLAAARHEANAALKLVPEWVYVRDSLLPQIEQQLRTDR